MHIENVHIHFQHPPALASALMAAILRPQDDPAEPPIGPSSKASAPAIGEPWPEHGGVYAGVSKGEGDEPDAHLVLLDVKPETALPWDKAVAWAEILGNGARLPSRFESALLYAHLQSQLGTTAWHWTGTQSSSDHAWRQHFRYGFQHDTSKSFEGRARAVRRLVL